MKPNSPGGCHRNARATMVISASRPHGGLHGRYVELVDALGVAVYVTDAEGRILSFNDAARELWGGSPSIGEQWWGLSLLLHPDGTPMPLDACPMAMALKERRAIGGAEAILERPDRSRVPFLAFATPLFDAEGELE